MGMRKRKNKRKYRALEEYSLSRLHEFDLTCPFCCSELEDWLRADGKRYVRCSGCGFIAEHLVIEIENQKACANLLAELQAFGEKKQPKYGLS